MEAKVKINLNEGYLELEGSEEFVSKYLELFESKLLAAASKDNLDSKKDLGKAGVDNKPEIKSSNKKGSNKTTPSKKGLTRLPKQLMDLNLRPKGKESLKDFYSKYDLKTNFEKNVSFTYYLTKVINIKGITIDHIYTCYKETDQKVPENIYQSLADTKKHKGWIDTTNMEDIKLSIQGENYIEHDVPRASAK
jgi:hypothetical protein